MERVYLNNDWKFTEEFSEKLIDKTYDDSGLLAVRLPHTCKEVPLHYFDEQEYQMVSGYRRVIHAPKKWKGKTLLLTFEGVAHDSSVYINGELVGEHHCGYTAFTIDISDKLLLGESNVITVRVDSNESLNIPPFGFVIDYMTFGGIYRDVYLDVKNATYIDDVFVMTKLAKEGANSATVSEVAVRGIKAGLSIRQSIRKKSADEEFKILDEDYSADINETDRADCEISNENDACDKTKTYSITHNTGKVDLWDVDSPVLYELKTELIYREKVIDDKTVTFGYRKAVFHEDGFYLNGRKLKIRGLNRHQSYPYVGYAMPESMQKMDADILKNELGLNAVRTSHYPQSQHFIDRCDELGLLVFTELPGWQHIGGEEWKLQAIENVKDMVKQYRYHASIILWGVRINESVDDDEFYERTNAAARALDPTRPTGGVRCYKNSNLLEDVYTYNDFLHNGKNKGCDKKSGVTSDMSKPYLISEYNGHMYPTKPFDWEEHRAEHAIRHANVLDEVAAQEDIAGSFGWCMFDYNTHKDFGSGDRICYHGVMDMFRNPKLAAAVYAIQQEEKPVLEISSSMDIGEHPGCNRGDIYILTNADSVKMYKNDKFIKEFFAEDTKYKNLKHAPVMLDDYIGDALEIGENMSHRQAEDLKQILNEAARVGINSLPRTMYLKAMKLVARYHMNMTDVVELYNRYIGDWGGSSTVYRFDAIKDGKVVRTVYRQPMKKVYIKADIDHTELSEKDTYDVAAVRITAADEYGNILSFFNDPLCLSVEGPVELIGPDIVCLSGGMGGTYIKTTGKRGKAKLTISSGQAEAVTIDITIV